MSGASNVAAASPPSGIASAVPTRNAAPAVSASKQAEAEVRELLRRLVEHGGRSLILRTGGPARVVLNHHYYPLTTDSLTTEGVERLLLGLFLLAGEEPREGAPPGLIAEPSLGTFYVRLYDDITAKTCIVYRVETTIPSFTDFNMPAQALTEVGQMTSGLVLITGPRGSGKSTTLASLLHHINSTQNRLIRSFEHVPQYVHRDRSGIVRQTLIEPATEMACRELARWADGDPDVVVFDPLRGAASLKVALDAAQADLLTIGVVTAPYAQAALRRLLIPEGHEWTGVSGRALLDRARAVIVQTVTPGPAQGRPVASVQVTQVTDSTRWEVLRALETSLQSPSA